MNTKYVNINGHVVVIDEKGNIVSHQDRVDFEEILAVKNSVEKIKREMDFLQSYPKQEEVLLIKPKEQLEELKRLIQDIHIFEYNSNNEKEAPKVYKK